MNIPVGENVVSGLPVKEIDPKEMLSDLISKSFNGYVAITIFTDKGYEDGIIIFESGSIVGSYYKHLVLEKEFFGMNGLKYVLNMFGAEYGVIDVFKLSKEQVELLLTFNERVKTKSIKNLSDIKDFFVSKYNPNLFEEKTEEVSKYDLFKKIGLGSLKI